MKEAIVYRNHEPAGRLIQTDSGFIFRYDDSYFQNVSKKSVSLTLSKKNQEYRSENLFPFFSNMLAEGVNRMLQCRHLQIDENDDFSLLLATAETNTIGAVTIKRASP